MGNKMLTLQHNSLFQGSDETFVCTAKDLVMSVQHGYNPGKENELLRSVSVKKRIKDKNFIETSLIILD